MQLAVLVVKDSVEGSDARDVFKDNFNSVKMLCRSKPVKHSA